jgi:hypothetical protein
MHSWHPAYYRHKEYPEVKTAKSEISQHAEKWSRELELRIRAALGEIHYGTVSLVIQDGKVIQIDKSEKIRLK